MFSLRSSTGTNGRSRVPASLVPVNTGILLMMAAVWALLGRRVGIAGQREIESNRDESREAAAARSRESRRIVE